LSLARISTIGGYGFTEQTFLRALEQYGVDTLVDVRQRRGLRGTRYSFLNSRHLQAILAKAGIRYLHAIELAPTRSIRLDQKRADSDAGVAKRERQALSPVFIERYTTEVLSQANLERLRENLGDANTVALFCVELEPQACHRSLAAQFLANVFEIQEPVHNLMP